MHMQYHIQMTQPYHNKNDFLMKKSKTKND